MRIYLLGMILFTAFCMSGQTKIPVNIDADLNDWDLPLRYLNNETKLNYMIVNSDSAFYVSVRVVEESMIMRIMKVGFQISLNTKGKKKEAYDIQFKPENDLSFEPSEKLNIQGIKEKFRLTPLVISLSGFTNTKNDIYLATSLKSIEYAMHWDSLNVLNIECKIPFSEMNYQLSDNEIALGIILFAIEPPSGAMKPPQGMGEPPSGMSPPQGKGFPPQDGAAFGELMTEKRIWLKVIPQL